MSTSTKLEARRRNGLVLFSSLYTFLVFGAFFGWGPMQLMLEDNGNFASKCTLEEQESGTICPEQSAALVNIHFFAIVTQIVSPVLGILADRYGSIRVAYAMTGCAWVGFGLLIVATRYVIDGLLYPAYILFALCTWMGTILMMHVGLFFEGHTRSRIIFGMSSLFDAGGMTFIGLRAIQENTAATVPQVIGGYFGLTLILFGGGSYFWTVARPAANEDSGEEEESIGPQNTAKRFQMTGASTSALKESDGIAANDFATELTTLEAGGYSSDEVVKHEEIDSETSAPTPAAIRSELDLVNNVVAGAASNNTEIVGHRTKTTTTAYKLVADRSPRHQLTSYPSLLLALFWLIYSTGDQWTLTTTRDFLATLGDDEVNNRYLTIFTFMMPASLVALPFTDALLRRFGFLVGFQAINILALGYTLIRLLSDSLNVQVLGFVIFSFYRSLFYGICLSFLPTLFAPDVVGTATGVLFSISGVSSFLNIPLSTFAIENENFFVPNLLYTILVVPCVVIAWALGHAMKREDEMKRNMSSSASAHLRESHGGVLCHDAHKASLAAVRTSE